MPPAAPLPLGPGNPRRFRPVPDYAQGTRTDHSCSFPSYICLELAATHHLCNCISDVGINQTVDIFADINFEANFDDEMFFGLWDDLPGLGLEPPGQIEGQAVRQPPQAPSLHPVGRQYHVLPHRVPEVAVDQPVLAANAPNIFAAVPVAPAQQNVQPQEYGWNAGPPQGGPQGGAQVFPRIPRQAQRAANEPLQPRMVFDNHETFIDGQRQRVQELRSSIANLQQIANAVPPPLPENQAAYRTARQQQRRQQPQRLLANLDLPLAMQPNAGVDAQQRGAVAEVRGRWPRHVGRGGAFNPANGQA
jgi:hypothetical protein